MIIHKGTPTREDLHKIVDMIAEGYYSGIDQPHGINWEVKEGQIKLKEE